MLHIGMRRLLLVVLLAYSGAEDASDPNYEKICFPPKEPHNESHIVRQSARNARTIIIEKPTKAPWNGLFDSLPDYEDSSDVETAATLRTTTSEKPTTASWDELFRSLGEFKGRSNDDSDLQLPAGDARTTTNATTTTTTEHPAKKFLFAAFGKLEDFGKPKSTEKPAEDPWRGLFPSESEGRSNDESDHQLPAGDARTTTTATATATTTMTTENPALKYVFDAFGKPEDFGKPETTGDSDFQPPAGVARTTTAATTAITTENPALKDLFGGFGKHEDFGKPETTENPALKYVFDAFGKPEDFGKPETTGDSDIQPPAGVARTTTAATTAITTENPALKYVFDVFGKPEDFGKPETTGDSDFQPPAGVARTTTAATTAITTEPPMSSSTLLPIITTRTEENDIPLEEGECLLEDKRRGICVPYYRCRTITNMVNTVGYSVLDSRLYKDCSDSLYVCCLSQATEDRDTMLNKFIWGSSPNLTQFNTDSGQATRPCGSAGHQGVDYRTIDSTASSTVTAFGEFPWMLGILKNKDMDPHSPWKRATYIGGASLIGPRAAITAAHTVFTQVRDGTLMKVRAGEWETKSFGEFLRHVESAVMKASMHEGYNSGTMHNDIAVLFLDAPILSAPHIGYVCLPPQGVAPPTGPGCYSTGWGSVNAGRGSQYANFLKKVSMPIVAGEPCEANLKATGAFVKTFRLHESLVCAGGDPGHDTCKGDGGSPLVCPIPGTKRRYVQYGIVAMGVGCGMGHPALYANVALFRHWIDQKMQAAGLDTSTYSN